MKSIYKTLLAAVCLLGAGTAAAQKIDITEPKVAVSDGRMDIALKIEASQLDLRSNAHLILEFVVEGDGSRLVLPEVVYTGRLRNLYERRNETLAGQYVSAPYHVENKVKGNKTYTLDYAVSVPFYPWMQHASVAVNEYLHSCAGDYQTGSRALVADVNPLRELEKPTVWEPSPEVYRKMIAFLVPEVETIKKRAAITELYIEYPVNVYEVRPAFGNNVEELRKADELMRAVTGNDLITVDTLNIMGYASPDGPYAGNERLAKNRAEGFKRYLIDKYGYPITRTANTQWRAEDWAGFRKMAISSNLAGRSEVLSIVDNGDLNPDAKEKALQTIQPWSDNYSIILHDMFPKLRRIELKADYTVQNINDDAKARELVYTNPGLLSLSEMYRVANLCEPGSKEYLDVYRIAAAQYPNDIIANNNAVAALLMAGDTEGAKPYLENMEHNINQAYINLGAYYYIEGDLKKAEHYFMLARAAGIEQAEQNLRLLKENR